jgi:hypothetical protein
VKHSKAKSSAPPASETRATSPDGYSEIDLAPLRDSKKLERRLHCYGSDSEASLAALFREIYVASDDSPSVAAYALEQLGYELTALRVLLESEEGRDLNTTIVLRVLRGLEARARAGAEIGKRMLAANEGGAS